MGSAEDEPRRSRIRIPAIYLPRVPARRGIAVPRAVRGARGVVSPPNGIIGLRRALFPDNLSALLSDLKRRQTALSARSANYLLTELGEHECEVASRIR